MQNELIDVPRSTHVDFINLLPHHAAHPVEGTPISVIQWVIDGVLVAQAIYNANMPPRYQIAATDYAERLGVVYRLENGAPQVDWIRLEELRASA